MPKFLDLEGLQRFKSKIDTYATPEMYGAVGNGLTDDSNAVQLAFGEGNKRVVFTKKYKIATTINIPSNSSLVFTEGGKIVADCSGSSLFKFNTTEAISIVGEGSAGSIVTGSCETVFDFEGTDDWQSSPENYARNIELSNVSVSGDNINNVCAFHKAVKQVKIHNCTFYAKNAIVSDGKAIEISISNSLLWNAAQDGVSVKISSNMGTNRFNEGWSFVNCTIDGTGNAFEISDIFVLQVSNCYIGKDVIIYKPTTTTQTGRINFVGNYIYADIKTNDESSGTSYYLSINNNHIIGGRIVIGTNSAYVHISNCAFSNNAGANAILVKNNSRVITINNIHIDLTYGGGISVNGAVGDDIQIGNVIWEAATVSNPPVSSQRPILRGELHEKKYSSALISPGNHASGETIASITRNFAKGESGLIIVSMRILNNTSNQNRLAIGGFSNYLEVPSATGHSSVTMFLSVGDNLVRHVIPYYCIKSGQINLILKTFADINVDYHSFFIIKRD